ncbi:putative late blight resistance protein homolog R1C-3 [Coffea arabica]|uniref:Late blight resistance protein homolog R1C-3 n=1 Tax=Coffea arabica TaxID=13443 RepID=A0ABM4U7J1_COFAR
MESRKLWMDCIIVIDSTSQKLRSLVRRRCHFTRDNQGLNELMVELRLVKTFLVCARELAYFWFSLGYPENSKLGLFYHLLRRLENGLPRIDPAGAASSCGDTLENVKQEISDAYVEMLNSVWLPVFLSEYRWRLLDYEPSLFRGRELYSKLLDCLLKSSSPRIEEFMEFLDSLLENLVDISFMGEACDSRFETLFEPLFEALQEKLVFLKNFILFARMQGKLDEAQKELMKHCGVVALSAAHLCYAFWFFRDDDEVLGGVELNISLSIEKIKPVYHEVRSAYIGVLKFQSASLTLSTQSDMFIVGDFVDSLLGNLWELLQNCPAAFMVSLKHQMQALYDGLRFLRNILKKQQEKYDGLDGRTKDLVGAVVNDAGVAIFSLYQKGIEEVLAKEIDATIFCLLDKIELIKEEVEKKHPLALKFDVSTTNTLELIDLLLENLKELASCKVDAVSFAEDRVNFLRSYLKKTVKHPTRHPNLHLQNMQEDLLFLRSFMENNLEQLNQNEKLPIETMQNDLVFLRSFLENNREQHNQHEELQAIWSQVIEVAHKAEFVIDSLVVGDVSFYSLMLLDNITEEIKLVKSEAQNATTISKHVTSQARSKWSTGTTHQESHQVANQESHQVLDEVNLVKTELSKIDDEKDVFKAQKTTMVLNQAFYWLPNFSKAAISKWRGEKTETLEIEADKYVIEAQEVTKSPRDMPSQSSISAINEVVVDLKDQEQAIIDQLIGGSKQFNIVSIVGMPGIGKTTLAQKVYHDPSIISHFHILAWCCISQVYSKKDLLLEILACIDEKDEYAERNENDLANTLRKHLKQKKYLTVLDDVWDTEAWNALKESFPDDTNGSRILLTSRNQEIPGKPHLLRLLTEEEGWELLQRKLEVTREEGYPPELDVLGRQIAKNCNGLPLSIVIISGILATLDQDGWEKVAERLSSNSVVGATGQCKSILELSYVHLPDHLKPCLLYFGAFREDQEIPIRRLMWLLVAEGFVQKNELESTEKIAEGYIMALINRSLVMVGQRRSTGGVKTCRIHDLLHVFCVGKAKDQNFLHLVQGYDEFLELDELQHPRRLSIYCQPKQFAKSRIFCPHLRSLQHSTSGVRRREVSYSLSCIHQMKLLRVLDLGHISLGFTFPNELCLLVRLRYLAVLGRMNIIPSSLANLLDLETFIVTTYYSGGGLSLLQDAFWNMQKLRHLHVRGALIDLSLANDNPESSSVLYNLDTFSTPKLYVGQSLDAMIRKFPNIRELKCCLLESEESTSDSIKIVAMDSLRQLESLKLLLSQVSPHHIELLLPSNLRRLTLVDFSWSLLSSVGQLSNLEVLKLIGQSDGDGVKEWDMEEGLFPNLKVLMLKSLNIVCWKGSEDNFPCLEKLVLEDCVELEELPSCLWETLTLQLIEVHGCLYSTGDLARDIMEKQMDYGNEDLKICISGEIEDTSSWSD